MIEKQKIIADSSSRGENKPVVSRRWSEEEKKFLKNWLDSGWDWVFPGYKVAALHVNNEFHNNRSAAACRAMDYRLCNAANGGVFLLCRTTADWKTKVKQTI